MINKKKRIFFILSIFLVNLLSLNLVYATDLSISSAPVIGTIINDNDKPAIFELSITNHGSTSNFEIYTFENFNLKPSNFTLSSNGNTKINLEMYPINAMKDNIGYVTVPIYIRDKNNLGGENEVHNIIVKLVEFKDAFGVKGENLNPDSNVVTVSFFNLEDVSYDNIDVVFSSSFFDDTSVKINSMKPYERYETKIPVRTEDLKKLVAGTYSIRARATLYDRTEIIEGSVKIVEKTGLSVSESKNGFLIREYKIEKLNEGNIPTVADVSLRKNIISRLFTTFSVAPDRVERDGVFVYYNWQKELSANEKLSVVSRTNWIFPFLLLIAIIIIIYLVNTYMKQNLIIKKSVGFVKTKDTNFALKVVLRVRARKFMERVTIYDRLPGIAKLYERFGEAPSKFDAHSGRMQWDIPRLAEGEERVFSYIFYSKINVIGKFELPPATGVYEILGKVYETISNRAFFINEPRRHEEA